MYQRKLFYFKYSYVCCYFLFLCVYVSCIGVSYYRMQLLHSFFVSCEIFFFLVKYSCKYLNPFLWNWRNLKKSIICICLVQVGWHKRILLKDVTVNSLAQRQSLIHTIKAGKRHSPSFSFNCPHTSA